MKRHNSYLIFIVSFFICSCNNSAIDRIHDQLKKNPDTRMINDMPERITSSTSGFETFRKRRASLGLTDLEKGIEGFELRIWDDENRPKKRLIVFRYTDKCWNARECIYKYVETVSLMPDSLSGKFVPLGTPKSGWDNFINSLLDMDILKLRDFESIPGYILATDEMPVIVEIGSNNYYKFYELPSARWHADRSPDAGKIVKILSVVADNYPIK